jgi:hypothetical protein
MSENRSRSADFRCHWARLALIALLFAFCSLPVWAQCGTPGADCLPAQLDSPDSLVRATNGGPTAVLATLSTGASSAMVSSTGNAAVTMAVNREFSRPTQTLTLSDLGVLSPWTWRITADYIETAYSGAYLKTLFTGKLTGHRGTPCERADKPAGLSELRAIKIARRVDTFFGELVPFLNPIDAIRC